MKRHCVSCEDVFVVSGHMIEPLDSKTRRSRRTRFRRYSTTIFSENVVLAEASCQMFGGLLFCDRERA